MSVGAVLPLASGLVVITRWNHGATVGARTNPPTDLPGERCELMDGGTVLQGKAIMSAESIVLHEDAVCRIEKSTDPAGLRLYGSLDVGARSILDRELENALRDGRDLYVDLSQLEFIEVGCVHTLLDVAAHLELDGSRLVLLGPNPTVRRIIAVCQEAWPRNVEIIPCPT